MIPRPSKATLVAAMLVLCVASAAAQTGTKTRERVRAWRLAHEKEIVQELSGLLALPNVATNLADVERNAEHLTGMLRRRGFESQVLRGGTGVPPAVYGELRTPGAKRTVVFYAHYDGQPVDPAAWASDPWKPVVRTGPLADGVKEVDLATHQGPLNPEWRIFARSASDDKSPIVALLAALDALKASGVKPSVNLKLFLEGEEEQGSPHLTSILRQHAELLKADAWVLCDGPVHQTRDLQLYFGARGVTGVNLTAYGPLRPLHSGHYGNWAPNPAVLLAHLVADLRDDERPDPDPRLLRRRAAAARVPSARAMAAMPDVETGLRRELGLARTERRRARVCRTGSCCRLSTCAACGRGGGRGVRERHPDRGAALDRLPPGPGPDAGEGAATGRGLPAQQGLAPGDRGAGPGNPSGAPEDRAAGVESTGYPRRTHAWTCRRPRP